MNVTLSFKCTMDQAQAVLNLLHGDDPGKIPVVIPPTPAPSLEGIEGGTIVSMSVPQETMDEASGLAEAKDKPPDLSEWSQPVQEAKTFRALIAGLVQWSDDPAELTAACEKLKAQGHPAVAKATNLAERVRRRLERAAEEAE